MEEKFISKALEANLAETRYKDIKIPAEYQAFIDLSKKYYGINKRANDCVIEFQHPFSNKKFVAEELRGILLTDYWFYIELKNPEQAFKVPVGLMCDLLLSDNDNDNDLFIMIIKTMLEFTQKLAREKKEFTNTISYCCDSLNQGFNHHPYSFIMSTGYFERYLKDVYALGTFNDKILKLSKSIFLANIRFWQTNSKIENWLEEKKQIINIDTTAIKKQIGKQWFLGLVRKLDKIDDWNDLVEKMPDFDQVAERFKNATDLFPTFIEKFYFIFYLLRLKGMALYRERLIWQLNKMLINTIDEMKTDELRQFVKQIFEFAEELRKEHMSSILDMFLTLGKKIIDLSEEDHTELVNYFENKLINFGFETPGMVFVDEDWQLSVNSNHIKNIRVWLQLIEYSSSGMERLLSTLIVNLKIGGIFISDTDLFQRDITNILNSNVAPYYKKVKQLTRIFPVYFNEIGAEGEIRKVTTTMDEISYRKDMLVHFLRKQVHTESNNTLIDLARKVFRFWYDGELEELKDALPHNVYDSVDKKSDWFAPIHQMVVEMSVIAGKSPDELISLEEEEFDDLVDQVSIDNKRDKERLRDIRRLYAFLKEKYSFETVSITELLQRYPFIEDSEIHKLATAFDNENFEKSLKLIYGFMTHLKDIIFNPKPSQSWENIYHKRHIAIGIPSMYGVYREPKFEALGLTFRLENVATRLMEKMVDGVNLNYISAKTLSNIYILLEYFREGLELDGITNQSFNANLLMLKYSLQSQSFSFEQYINIFQFLADDVKRIILKHFLKTYEIPLQIVIPQLFDPKHKLSEKDKIILINKTSEKFYRDVIAEAFLMQPLDNFITRILESLRKMADQLPPKVINEVMSYNSDLVITRLRKQNALVDNQVFLGSKAYHLKNLRMAGFPVPPGFVLTTEMFRKKEVIMKHEELRKEMFGEIRSHLALVENVSDREFGNPANPLLLSVRSGAAISMPGAMDTFLNVGMNYDITESLSKMPGFEWTAWDSYRRLLQSWGMALGLNRDLFDEIMTKFKAHYKVAQKIDFPPETMKEIALAYHQKLMENNINFEEDVFRQLITIINFVLDSWSSERAKVYRQHLEIADEWGTAVVVQRMVFGNIGKTSGTGVVFTQNPKKKQQGVHLYGDFTLCSQGEDIVAGLVKPLPVSKNQRISDGDGEESLEEKYPEIYKRIQEIAIQLVEEHGYSPQEIEFTFESASPDDLYILQTRDLDMARHQAVNRFSIPVDQMKLAGRGIGIGGSALNGKVAFDMDDIISLRKKYKSDQIVLVRPDTVPDDIGMIFETDGLLTAKGGATSHAAVTAVRLGKTSVVNCTGLLVDDGNKTCSLNKLSFKVGDSIAIDGYTGNVYHGNYPIETGQDYSGFRF